VTSGRVPSSFAGWGADGGAWAIVVHGGAGDGPSTGSGASASDYEAGCRRAIEAGALALRGGLGALDAVERAVRVLEDDPLFNAGTGACLDAAGLIELDAAIMEGTTLRAGAVCALPPFRNPIVIARAALEDGRHVLYAGEGAAAFAVERGFERTTSEAMTTAYARARWAALRGELADLANRGGPQTGAPPGGGTVGAVARDPLGQVAAATSTGGLVNKRVGRVGDAPLLGAGTYADDDGGACSATGHGESIMRLALAKAAIDFLRARVHPEDAARAVVGVLGSRLGGSGGVILVDRSGRMGWSRNTLTMPWAAQGERVPLIAGL
jgi:L-asparaginase / beta-aspartyl-peptidase